MPTWDGEAFDEILNEGMFRITEPGPLPAPIDGFSIRSDENLKLILETTPSADATSNAVDRPAGTLRLSR